MTNSCGAEKCVQAKCWLRMSFVVHSIAGFNITVGDDKQCAMSGLQKIEVDMSEPTVGSISNITFNGYPIESSYIKTTGQWFQSDAPSVKLVVSGWEGLSSKNVRHNNDTLEPYAQWHLHFCLPPVFTSESDSSFH